jgi:hypothetical protein
MDETLNKIQLYSENSSVKYPLDDQYTEDIPTDILMDLSLSVPYDAGIITCTNIVVKSSFVFVSFEGVDYPVGHVFVANPVPFRIYTLTMSCAGSGWIVFGPGVSKEFSIKGSTAAVDKRCMLHNVTTDKVFKLSVNGREYDMPPILNIATNVNVLSMAETRTVDSTSSRSLVLKRDDTKFTDTMLKTGLVKFDPQSIPLATINGIFPDSSGDITLAINTEDSTESAYLVKAMSAGLVPYPLGFVILTDNMRGCPDAYKDLERKIKKSDTGYGLQYRLPLDCMFVPEEDESSDSFTYPCPEGY